eukprot:3975355-Pleurochrysis_carterae.AAC.1
MKKTGRTRSRNRGAQRDVQRQPDFADTDTAPDTQGTLASVVGDGTPMEGTPPEEGRDIKEEREEERGERLERGDVGAGSSETRVEAEAESEEGSLSEDSEDSQGWTGDRKEKRLYWKEVEKKVERDISESLEHAQAARHAIYEKQVRELGTIVDLTSSEGEEEGEIAEQRRARRKEREEVMAKKRSQKEDLHREYQESQRHITLDERVVRELRRKHEAQLEQTKQARAIGKRLRAKRRVAVRKEETRAREAREKRRLQAAKRRGQQEEEGRGDTDRKRRNEREGAG